MVKVKIEPAILWKDLKSSLNNFISGRQIEIQACVGITHDKFWATKLIKPEGTILGHDTPLKVSNYSVIDNKLDPLEVFF